MSGTIPAFVLGGSGYVAGELLRLIAAHPHFALAAVMSESQPGEAVAGAFPHLLSAYPLTRFSSQAEVQKMLCEAPQAAVFSAAPHGVSAGLIDTLLSAAEKAGRHPRVVDISADFRYSSAAAYAAVYPHAHGAPGAHRAVHLRAAGALGQARDAPRRSPGLLRDGDLARERAAARQSGSSRPALFVSGVTGSTGSGRKPVPGTHHPLRHGDLYSYSALVHRHVPEVAACARAASGVEAEFAFVPHSGPFARGIHVTVQAALSRPLDTEKLLDSLRAFYADAPFVRISEQAPRVKDVVASNHAHLSAVTMSGTVAVMCALDNLTKGAAGGALQWMNRMFALPESAGLTAPAPGWT